MKISNKDLLHGYLIDFGIKITNTSFNKNTLYRLSCIKNYIEKFNSNNIEISVVETTDISNRRAMFKTKKEEVKLHNKIYFKKTEYPYYYTNYLELKLDIRKLKINISKEFFEYINNEIDINIEELEKDNINHILNYLDLIIQYNIFITYYYEYHFSTFKRLLDKASKYITYVYYKFKFR